MYESELLLAKGRSWPETAAALTAAQADFADAPAWEADALEAVARAAAEAHGWKAGDFFRPIRVAITGRMVSPPLFGSMALLGRDQSRARIEAALERLRA